VLWVCILQPKKLERQQFLPLRNHGPLTEDEGEIMGIYKLFLNTKTGTMPMFLSEDEYNQITQEGQEPLDLMSLLSGGQECEGECDECDSECDEA
jgi:hypothetical protein